MWHVFEDLVFGAEREIIKAGLVRFAMRLKDDIIGRNPESEIWKNLLFELGADIDLPGLWRTPSSGIVENRDDRQREFINGKGIIGLDRRRKKAISHESVGSEFCRETIKGKNSGRDYSCNFH